MTDHAKALDALIEAVEAGAALHLKPLGMQVLLEGLS